MKTFEDRLGRKWTIEITFGLCKRINAAMEKLGVNLLEPLLPRGADAKTPITPASLHAAETSLFVELQVDLPLFFDVLTHAIEAQAKEEGVPIDGDGGFGDAMAGDHLFAAQQAFFEEWSDFFRSLHRVEVVAAMEKMAAWWGKTVETMKAQIEDPEVAKLVDAKLGEAMSNASGKLRESLAEIPTD